MIQPETKVTPTKTGYKLTTLLETEVDNAESLWDGLESHKAVIELMNKDEPTQA